MPMTAACFVLQRKRCRFIADKLAILGNLASYPLRINTDDVVDRNLSYSACAIAMALYNGDLSILFCQGRLAESFSAHENSQRIPKPLASWLPFHKLSLNNITLIPSMNTRFQSQIRSGSRCLIINGKIALEGLLWEIVPFHDLSLRTDVWGQSGIMAGSKRPVPGQFLLMQLLAEEQGKMTKAGRFCLLPLLVRVLFGLERRDILEIVVVAALQRTLDSPSEIFSIISELEEWMYGKRAWPDFVDRGKPQKIHTLGDKVDEDTMLTWSLNKVLLGIYDGLSRGLPLALGKCNVEGETLISIFNFSPTGEAGRKMMIFTPMSELDYEFDKNTWPLTNNSFWCVRDCGDKVSDGDIQKAKGGLGQEVNLSDQILEVSPEHSEKIQGVWSPRIKATGILNQDPKTKSLKLDPLGKCI